MAKIHDLAGFGGFSGQPYDWAFVAQKGDESDSQINKFQEQIFVRDNLTVHTVGVANATLDSRSTTTVELHLVDLVTVDIVKRKIQRALTSNV